MSGHPVPRRRFRSHRPPCGQGHLGATGYLRTSRHAPNPRIESKQRPRPCAGWPAPRQPEANRRESPASPDRHRTGYRLRPPSWEVCPASHTVQPFLVVVFVRVGEDESFDLLYLIAIQYLGCQYSVAHGGVTVDHDPVPSWRAHHDGLAQSRSQHKEMKQMGGQSPGQLGFDRQHVRSGQGFQEGPADSWKSYYASECTGGPRRC